MKLTVIVVGVDHDNRGKWLHNVADVSWRERTDTVSVKLGTALHFAKRPFRVPAHYDSLYIMNIFRFVGEFLCIHCIHVPRLTMYILSCVRFLGTLAADA